MIEKMNFIPLRCFMVQRFGVGVSVEETRKKGGRTFLLPQEHQVGREVRSSPLLVTPSSCYGAMMKYLLLLSTLTLSLMFSSGSSAEWTSAWSTSAGDKYYLDLDRIRMNDGYLYVWYLTDLIKPTESGIMSVKGYWEIDCKAFHSRP